MVLIIETTQMFICCLYDDNYIQWIDLEVLNIDYSV